MKKNFWIAILIVINILAIGIFIVWLLNRDYPLIGHDYRLFMPYMLDSYLHQKINGLTVQWYTPSFAGGRPVFSNPQDLQFSLPQFLLWIVNPWVAIQASIFTFIAAGFVATYYFLKRIIGLGPFAGILGAVFFVANGFYFEHMAAGHLTYQLFPLFALIMVILLHPSLPLWLASVLFSLLSSLIIYTGIHNSNNNPINYNDPTGHCPGPGGHDFPEGNPQCNSGSGIPSTKYSAEEEAILLKLISFNDPKALMVLNYIRMNGVHIYADPKIKSGAEWGLDGNIYINTGQLDPNDPWTVTSALHEGLHLTQGKYVARSVYGEQEAWQLQYSAWQTMRGSAWPKNSEEWNLLDLPLDGKRPTLTKAENLMIKMSPGYPIKWYPFNPYPEFSIGMDIAMPLIHLYLGINGYSYH